MIEILALFGLGNVIQKIALKKGLKQYKYILLMVVLWFSFEIIGAWVGIVFFGIGFTFYFTGLLGAALGGLLSYLIAKNAKPQHK